MRRKKKTNNSQKKVRNRKNKEKNTKKSRNKCHIFPTNKLVFKTFALSQRLTSDKHATAYSWVAIDGRQSIDASVDESDEGSRGRDREGKRSDFLRRQ